LLKNEDYAQAVERFTEVIEVNPNFAEGYNTAQLHIFRKVQLQGFLLWFEIG